ncbi:MAG: InlB B-repeat-containing protein [Clostridiales bacterium]|nr:InlB B-repeat-containing protein [Clostridiales bacterium]
MKRNRFIKVLLACLIVAAMAVTVAACEKDDKQPASFTVSFTGEGVNISSQTVTSGGFAIEPKSPEREGYEFTGWLLNGEKYVFETTPVTANITLTADWKEKTVEPPVPTPEDKGDGSEEKPYILSTPEDLISFSDRVNNPFEEGNETYYKSYFRLGADIDMAGYVYKPAGRVVTNGAEEDDEGTGTTEAVTVNGFMGNFDGNGHTIKNLTLTSNIRSGIDYVGFFGVTDKASIHDLTLEDIDYTVTIYSNVTNCGVSYGGVVGLANLTNFTNVSVTGTLTNDTLENNTVHIGGIAGNWRIEDSDEAYIAYMENCYVNVTTKLADNQDASLENAVNGGLVGYLYTYNGAAAIVNCVADGKVYGGKYLGGLAAYIFGNFVSVINCANYAEVTATSTSGSYTGGIVGFSTGNNVIMDSFAAGRVKGKKTTSSTYNSYAGNLGAYIEEDSYDGSYDAGTVFANCWYKNYISASGVINTNTTMKLGNEKADGVFTEEWVRSTLKWSESSMLFDENGKARPAKKTDSDKKYTVTLDGTTVIDRTMNGDFYQLVGSIAKPAARDGELFFDYYVEEGVRYRFFVPVVKDMTLTAKWTDPTEICGVYTGEGKIEDREEGKVDGGVLYLKKDGSAQWINDTIINGEYTFDGEHILFTRYDNVGDFSGKYNAGKISYIVDAGITGEVYYYFTASDLKLFGNYFADNGDILTFSSNNSVSIHVSSLNNDNTVNGTYTVDGNNVTVTSGKLTNYYTSMNITINEEDETIVVNFVGKDAEFSIADVTFRKQNAVDYTGKSFIGKYSFAYINTTSENYVPGETYKIEFKPDGTMIYSSAYSDTRALYYVFGDGTLFKFAIEGDVSTFTYDAERNIFYGNLNRGIKIHKSIILTPEAYGEQFAYAWTDLAGSANPGAGLGEYDAPTMVIVAGEHYYYINNKTFMPDAVIVAEQGFVNGAEISVDGVPYRVIVGRKAGYNSISRIIKEIGKENGTYTYNGETVVIDGIGGVAKGDVKGTYRIYENNLVVCLFDDDTIIGFDYTAAQSADNVITLKEQDKYCGVRYLGKNVKKGEDDKGKDIYEYNAKYYKFVFNGYGRGSVLYYNDDDKEYRFNWGGAYGWAAYTETDTGIHIKFNEYNEFDVTFFYDMNVAYVKNVTQHGSSFKDGDSFAKADYTGTTELPKLPENVSGKYTGVESDGTAVVLNVKDNLTVGYKGSPYVSAIFDGTDKVYFKINGVSYTFNTTTKVLTYGSESVTLTAAGEVTEVIPAFFCGTWEGTFVTTAGGSGQVWQITVNAEGTIIYGEYTITAIYDMAKQTVSGKSSDGIYEITLTYDADNNVLKGTIEHKDEDMGGRTYESNSLTKK